MVTFEIGQAINHYKSSLQRLIDVLLSIPDKHAELPSSSSANSKVDIDEKTILYMRKLSRKGGKLSRTDHRLINLYWLRCRIVKGTNR